MCVKNSVHRGGLPQCMLGYHHPTPGPGTNRDQAHPHHQAPPPPRAGTPRSRHTPRNRACWEIQSTSGRYASYWNYCNNFNRLVSQLNPETPIWEWRLGGGTGTSRICLPCTNKPKGLRTNVRMDCIFYFFHFIYIKYKIHIQ